MAKQPKFTHDWEKERKKLKVLWLILVASIAAVVVLVIISLLRTHL